MSTTRNHLLSLAEVAALTGRHPELLRQWCAAGRLPCERIAGAWTLPESDLALVEAAPSRGRRRRAPLGDGAAHAVVAAGFMDGARGKLVHRQLQTRYGLHATQAGAVALAIDGVEMVLVAVRVPRGQATEAADLLESLGGRVLATTVGSKSAVRPSPPANNSAG